MSEMAYEYSLCCNQELLFIVCNDCKNKNKLSSKIGYDDPYFIYECDFYNVGFCTACNKLHEGDKIWNGDDN